MLVTECHKAVSVVPWRRGVWASSFVFFLAVFSLSPYLTSSTELVRMRNSLLLADQQDPDFNWTPASVPPSYQQELGPIDPVFIEVANRLQLAKLPNDWERALTISRHLLGSNPVLKGGAIQSNLRETYQRIVRNGDGYCSDFVRVFTAIALAAEIPVRSWAFSFDGFGGHGHIWPEIWNRQLGRWQLVGIFNNYFFFETEGVPLSAIEFRQAMLRQSQQLKLAPLYPGARVGWVIESKAWDYYRRGLSQWYMWWGNDVFTYDQTFVVKIFSGRSRMLEQMGSIIVGAHPKLKLMVDDSNQEAVDAILRLRFHMILVGCFGTISALSLLFCSLKWIHACRRRAHLLDQSCLPRDVT